VKQEGESTCSPVRFDSSLGGIALLPEHEFNQLSYPAMPLSRVLHPINSPHPYHEAIVTIRAARQNNLLDTGTGFVKADYESKDELRLEPTLKMLNQVDAREFGKRSASPRTVGGILSALNAFNIMPVDPSIRNTELLYYCELA
jgi:hypothetical protein